MDSDKRWHGLDLAQKKDPTFLGWGSHSQRGQAFSASAVTSL